MWFLRFQKFTSCVSAVCFCFVFCFFCDLSKQPITLHSVLKMWFLSVRKDLMRLHYRWWNNVTELSQDVAPRESSSLPPAAPLAFSGAKAVWTAARRSANQCEIKTSIQWLTHTHTQWHLHTYERRCTEKTPTLTSKWHLIILVPVCNELFWEGKNVAKWQIFFFVLSWRSRIFRATGFGEWCVLILDLMCTVDRYDCSNVPVWRLVKLMSVTCHGKNTEIIRELVTSHSVSPPITASRDTLTHPCRGV